MLDFTASMFGGSNKLPSNGGEAFKDSSPVQALKAVLGEKTNAVSVVGGILIEEDVPMESIDDCLDSLQVASSAPCDYPFDEDIPMESINDYLDLLQIANPTTYEFPFKEDIPMESMDILRDYYRNNEMAQLRAELGQIETPVASFGERTASISANLPKKSYAYAEIARHLIEMNCFMRLDKSLYLRVGVVWRKISSDDIQELFSSLPQMIADGLNHAAAEGIYKKIYHDSLIRIKSEDLLENPNLVALRDGFYDIENGRIYEAGQEPDSFLCLNAGVREIGKGAAADYERFLESTFSNDDASIMRFEETQGAILTTHPLKNIFLYKGEPDSGKSVIEKLDIELLKNTSGIGDEQQHIMPLDNINRLSKQFGIGDATSRWLILCGDAAKVAINESTAAMLKQLSGNDYVREELKFANASGGYFKGRILLLSNHPLHGAIDDALRGRIVMTPFRRSIPKEDQIPDLHKILYENRGQILYRFFQAMRRLLSNKFQYTPVKDDGLWATNSSISVENTVDTFVKHRTTKDSTSFMTTQELYDAYTKYCDIEGLPAVSDTGAFGKYLRANCPWLTPCRDSKSRGYQGIRLI